MKKFSLYMERGYYYIATSDFEPYQAKIGGVKLKGGWDGGRVIWVKLTS